MLFLPPLLYAGAFFANLRDLRANLRPITLLSIGLVLATMVVVAVVAHELIDGMSWPAAFALGAIVGPTDPVAGDRDRAPARRAAAARLGARGRVAGQRRDRARRLPDRRPRGHGRGGLLAAGRGWDFVWKAAGGIAIGLVVGLGDRRRSARGSTTR